MSTATAERLERDAVSWTAYGTIFCWGWLLYAFGAVLPLLRDEQGISRTVLGLHSLALAVGGVLAGLASVRLTSVLRRRGAALFGAAVLTLGMVLFVSGPVTAVTLAGALVIGVGGSALVNSMIAAISEHHAGFATAALTEGNAGAAVAGVVSPLLVGGGVALGLTWRPGIALVLVPLGLTIGLLVLRSRHDASFATRGTGSSEGGRRLPAAFWIPLLVLVAATAVEFCAAAWSADLLRQRAGLSAGFASAAISAVVSGMAVGRLVVGRLALRYGAAPLFTGALVLAGAGWVLVWTATSAVPALLGLVVMGLGIAGHYPLGMSMALATAPGQREQAVGALSVGVGSASGGGPFLLGALADATSTHTAFLVVPVLLSLAGALILLERRRSRPTPAPFSSFTSPVEPMP